MTEVPRVHAADPINLLFGGMATLGPGANDETLQALRLLPQEFATALERFTTMLEQHR
jgi:hypothetical protein